MNLRMWTGAILLVLAAAAAGGASAQSQGQFARAIKQDNYSAIQEMIDKGFDPNTKDEFGQPGIVMALHEGSINSAKVLANAPGLKLENTNSHDETALMMAAWAGQLEIAKTLVGRGASITRTGWSPLHYAATNGHIKMMRYLLGMHADIDALSPNGTTPLMMAVGYSSPEAVKFLIEAGADINIRNEQGLSALDFAKRYARPDAQEMLEQAKAYEAQGKSYKRQDDRP